MRVFLLLPLLFSFIKADYPVVKTILARHSYACLDGNGTIYFIDEKLNLCMTKAGAETVKKFSVTNYGTDPLIDASNPLEVFLFFPTTGKVVIFDNQLNVQQELNVYGGDNLQPLCFGRANDGNIWLLDNNSLTLKKFSRQGDVLLESVILKRWVADNVHTDKIYDNGNFVVLKDAEGKVYVFNQNLILENVVEDNKTLLGLQEKGMLVQKGKVVCQIMEPGSKAAFCDTVAILGEKNLAINMNQGWLLESNDSALILRANR